MNKKTLAFTFGSAIVTVLATGSVVDAQENPFGMRAISNADMIAAADEKTKEGKCGEAKCGASKTKMKEGSKEGTATMPEEKNKETGDTMPDDKTKKGDSKDKM